MNSDRAQAYGRVIRTIEDVGEVKLQPGEADRVRQDADALFFCEDLATDTSAQAAIADMRELREHLTDTERWSEERAQELADDVLACGPLVASG